MNFPFRALVASQFDVVGFGSNAIDYLIRVPEYPSFNSKIELSEYTQAAGGEVASTLVGLQRLGLKTAYAGRFGGDTAGELVLRSLVDEGVDVTYAETVPGAKTQVAFIIIDERNGERTILWQRDKKLAYAAPEAPLEAATLGKVLHLTPHDTFACIRLAQLAREKGVIVSIDIDNVFDGVEELLPLVDVCVTSPAFIRKLLGRSDNKTALRDIKSRFGCAVVGLTLGSAGSLILCDDTFIETQGFEVTGGCVDTTGAGDAFRAGFLYGLITGETVEESARMANAVAALKCRGVGARLTLPNETELKAKLRKL